MKHWRLIIVLVVLGFLAACTPTPQSSSGLEPLAPADDLIITGVIDGPLSGGVPKAIELYAVNDIPDLSIYGLGSANNGNGGGEQEFTLAGAAEAGDYIFVASEEDGFTSFFGFAPDFTSSVASINGDDAIELFTAGVVTDVFGDVATDGSGEAWEYLDGWAYRSAGTGPDGTSFVIGSWTFSGPNALDGETVNASAETPFPLCSYAADGNCGTAPPPPPPPTGDVTPIHTIQGEGVATPLNGQVVTIEGIVVGDFQANDGDAFGTDLGGFFVQEEDADADDNPATSEGIFVFARDAVDVSVGDKVSVTGTAGEFREATQLSDVTNLSVLESKLPLPAVTDLTLPFESDEVLEAVEGMYVRLPQELVISEYFNFDRFGEIVLALPLPGEDRLYQPTATAEPGSMSAADRAAYNDSARITLDDGRTSQNPDPARHPNGNEFTLDNRFRGGDTVTNTVGVLNYAFDLYRIQPTAGADYSVENPRPAQPENVGGTLKVASFNVLNYFNGDGMGGGFPTSRGADDPEEFARQEAKIVSAIIGTGADIVGLIEIENDPEGETSALDDLTEALNAAAGKDTYAFVETGTDGTDEIKVAFVYKPGAVMTVGDAAVLEDASFTSPRGEPKNRPALAQTFAEKATGGTLTVVVNHFKSKGSGCGEGDDDPQQGSCNLTRTLAAQALTDWLATDPTGSGDTDVLIIGDLNAYDKEDPIDVFTSEGYTDLALQFGGELAYSYLFGGELGYLDYALANASLLPQVTGTTEWHINADEPDILDYDTSFKQDAQDALFEPNPYRSSDHDPVIVGLALEVEPQKIIDLIRAKVEHLRAEGFLNRGQAQAINRILDFVERQLDRDRIYLAERIVYRLERRVNFYMHRGILPEVEGQQLLELLRTLKESLH